MTQRDNMSVGNAHHLEYFLVRLLEAAASALPRPAALRFGSALGWLLYATGALRRVVLTNMRHTGYWTDEEVVRLIPGLYRTMGRYIADFLRAGKRTPPFRFDGDQALRRCLERGKGTIVVLGHLGNWEMLANIFGTAIPDLNVVAMPMNNPAVEKWLHAKRTATGAKTIHKHNAVRPMLATLRRNGTIAVLIDQNAGRQGTMVPFLGKDASTVRTVAGLLRRTDCSIIAGAAILRPDGSYDILWETGQDLGIPKDPEDAFVLAYQTAHNDILSKWIRQCPEHYFGWFHKRFRGTVNYRG